MQYPKNDTKSNPLSFVSTELLQKNNHVCRNSTNVHISFDCTEKRELLKLVHVHKVIDKHRHNNLKSKCCHYTYTPSSNVCTIAYRLKGKCAGKITDPWNVSTLCPKTISPVTVHFHLFYVLIECVRHKVERLPIQHTSTSSSFSLYMSLC